MRSASSWPGSAPRVDRTRAIAAACIVATAACWAYTQTLLPGVDPGDTGGFQAAVLWPETSARQGYPLYYALARPFVLAASADNPARGLNLFSALLGGVAVGILSAAVSLVAGSVLGGLVAGLLAAASYTFWTQAVIAEVYTLHLALIGLSLLALEAFRRRPATARLALFFAVYALAFGNHLGMILLFIPFTAFLFAVHPEPRQLVRPRVIGLAIGAAAAGALQYAPNFLALWTSVDAPDAAADRLAAFWFDVTKADWRDASVLGIEWSRVPERLSFWAWDARHQFGIPGLLLAAVGAVRLWFISKAWAACLWLGYAATAAFAITYNVGDAHVFFLPSHYVLAFAAGAAFAPGHRAAAGTAPAGRPRAGAILRQALALSAVCFALWRGWTTWPAVDRHDDERGEQLAAGILRGLDDRRAVLLSGLDWESENALLYTARYQRRNVSWLRVADVLPYLPFFIRDNLGIGRDVVMTAEAAAAIRDAYGPIFPIVPDEPGSVRTLSEVAAEIPRAAPYVLSILLPLGTHVIDDDDVALALSSLTGGTAARRDRGAYEVFAGVAGYPPLLHRSADRPFTANVKLIEDAFRIRMDGWLPGDTFRRDGFGHVIRGHRRVMTLERGINLVWLDGSGQPRVFYASGIHAARPRFRIPASARQRARAGRGAPPGLAP